MKHIPLLIIIGCLIACGNNQNDASSFSTKWKSTSVEERGTIADANKIYRYLKGKSKEEVKMFLGEPDKVDEFGDFIYLIRKNKAGDLVYDLTCLIAFDNGPVVKRVEVAQP